MIVLGLNFGSHDPSAAIVINGRIVSMIEQERISRKKRAPGEPSSEAVEYCLRQADITPSQVDAIAIGWDVELFNGNSEPFPLHQMLRDVHWSLPKTFASLSIPVYYVRHHIAHAACAFYSSGFDDAAILIVDGQGESESTTIAVGDRDGVRPLLSLPISQSLGYFYLAASRYAGFPGEGEGKFMGLAAYGTPNQPMPLSIIENQITYVDAVKLASQSIPKQRDALYNWWAVNCYPYSLAETKKEPFAYSRFAASVQRALEEVLLQLARQARELTGSNNLVIAGGVAQNCSANRVLVESELFSEYFIPPVSHDGGVSLGAALEIASRLEPGGPNAIGSKMEHAYWGPKYEELEIEEALRHAQLEYNVLSEDGICETVAELLTQNRIVGWFQGRAEIGPRALGARSILANPMIRSNVTRINTLKGREEWRPLAPSVLEEEYDVYFRSNVKSPFMNVAVEVRDTVRSAIPAVVHVDNSARPQAVSQKFSPLYWGAINEFKKHTGIGVVLNTSFNLWYEPIVNSPRDAIETFKKGGLDALAIGRYLVMKGDGEITPRSI